jgi:predicted kinase
MEPEIVLIRGIPGSGKTTMAKKMLGYHHLEADMYLEVNGRYVYNPSKVPKAHDWCVASAKAALEQGRNVVVSNTFAKKWELQRYIDLGFPFRIVEATGTWPNVHGVPKAIIEKMRARWEPLSKLQ